MGATHDRHYLVVGDSKSADPTIHYGSGAPYDTYLGEGWTSENLAVGGERIGEWEIDDGYPHPPTTGRFDTVVGTPDVVGIWLGENDSRDLLGSPEYKTSMENLIDNQILSRWPNAEILIIIDLLAVGKPLHADRASQLYEDRMNELRVERALRLPFVDLQCLPITEPMVPDGIHPNDAAHQIIGTAVRAALDVVFQIVTVADMQARFPSLIDYSDPAQVDLLQLAINDAIADALDQNTWGDDELYKRAVEYLAAHYATLAIEQAAGADGALYPVQSATAGSVSQTSAVPSDLPPEWAPYYATSYGQTYVGFLKRVVGSPIII